MKRLFEARIPAGLKCSTGRSVLQSANIINYLSAIANATPHPPGASLTAGVGDSRVVPDSFRCYAATELSVLGTQEERRRTGAGDEFGSEFVPAMGDKGPLTLGSVRLPIWYVLKHDVSVEKLLCRILQYVGMGTCSWNSRVDHDEWEQVLDMPHVTGILGWMMPFPGKQSELPPISLPETGPCSIGELGASIH
jgi:hypothetical protein